MEGLLQRPMHFPDDVLIEIFLRLPVRSLLLFRSLSKHWLDVFQSPFFIHLHNNRPNHIDNPILLVHAIYSACEFQNQDRFCYKTKDLTRIYDDRTATLPYKDDNMSLKTLSPSIYSRPFWIKKGRLLGPCNGLFCITDTVDAVIFNPATKRCRKVPPSPLNDSANCVDDDAGHYNRVSFGFDTASRDYKVVGFRDVTQQHTNNDGRHYYWVHIFSLSTNSWTQVNSVVPASDVHRLHNYDLFFNNAVHWVGCGFNKVCSIVVFDLNKEVFKLIELPSDNNFTVNDWVYPALLDECFTIILHKGSKKFQIWVMEEYGDYNSWTELYNINVGMSITRPLSFSKDGEFLLENIAGRLVSFNLKTREMKRLGAYTVSYAFRYTERLISLKSSIREECESKQKIEMICKFMGL